MTERCIGFNYKASAYGCLLLMVAGMTGCGGGSESPPAPAQAPPKKPVAPIKPVVKKSPATLARTTPDKKTQNQAKSKLPPGTDPNDVFKIVTDPPVYKILGPAKAAPPGDPMIVTKPPQGRNSSNFTITYRPSVRSSFNRDRTFQLPDNFEVIESSGYADDGRPWRIRSIPDEMVMAYVPGGEFIMGSDAGSGDAAPQIKVELDPFYIDTTEVTLKSFNKYRDYMQQQKKRSLQEASNNSSPENHPALGITWADANGYAKILGKDLPTEAQWELAARGPESLVHPWGNSYAIWPKPRSLDQISPVQSFQTDQSFYGVFDMAGNAREWCQDWYSADAYKEAANSEKRGKAIENYKGPRRSDPKHHHVAKGNGPGWVLWHRWPLNMRERYDDVGFRTVLNVPKAPEPEKSDISTTPGPGTPGATKPKSNNPDF